MCFVGHVGSDAIHLSSRNRGSVCHQHLDGVIGEDVRVVVDVLCGEFGG